MNRLPIDSSTWFADSPPLEVAFTRNAEAVDGEEDARLQVEEPNGGSEDVEWRALFAALPDLRDWP